MWYQVFLSVVLFIPPADELSLSGTVFNPEAAPVPNADVLIENFAEGRRWELQTSDSGEFRLERLPLGTYRLLIHKDGFFDAQTEVRLEASKTIEFTLAPAERLSEEVEVIARPEPINPDSLSTGETVNDEVIQNLPFTGRRNFLNALALMPGVVNDNTGGLHMHGSSSSQIRYQLDGMNLTNPGTGGIGSRIPIDSIESVDLDLAGYSAEFGKGSGGVVRVNSQFIQNQFRWNLTDFVPGINFKRKTIGEFSPRLLLSGPIAANKLWFMYSGSSRYVPTFKEDLPEGSNRQTQTIVDQLLKLQWNVAEANVLTVNFLHNSEYYGNLGLSPSRPLEATTNFLRRGATIAVSDRAMIGKGVVLETVIQGSRRHESDLPKGLVPMEAHPEGWRGNFFAEQRGRTSRIHFAQTAAWEKVGVLTHRFKAGFEFDAVDSQLSYERRRFDVFNSAGDVESTVEFFGPTTADVHNREYGLFFQDRIARSKAFQIELGIRADRESIIGRTNLAPRAAFSYLPLGTERSKVSGGIGIFYDNVTLDKLQIPHLQRTSTSTVGIASHLKNPYGIHWNLSWEQEWAPRWVTRINTIHKHGKDQVRVAAPRADDLNLEVNNSGTARYRAIELSLDRPIRTNLRLLASYVYSTSVGRPSIAMDFPDPALEAVPEAPLAWDVPHRFLGWGYFPFVAGMNASFSMEARTGFPYTHVDNQHHALGAYNASRLPTYFVVNASFEKEVPTFFGKRMAVRVGALNLFNRFNPRFVDANVNSATYGKLSDSTGRGFVARLRILK